MPVLYMQGVLAMLCCGVDVAATGVLLALKDTAFVVRPAMHFAISSS